MKKIFFILNIILNLTILLNSCASQNKQTRGIGLYPGNITENFSPILKKGKQKYTNLALNKATYSSSCYDYNLTSQLATDGIITNKKPYYIKVYTNKGIVNKEDRNILFDYKPNSSYKLKGNKVYIELEAYNKNLLFDSIQINGIIKYKKTEKGLNFNLKASNNGNKWILLKNISNNNLIFDSVPNIKDSKKINIHFNLNNNIKFHYYRLTSKSLCLSVYH